MFMCKGNMYGKNKIVPKTDPWETPYFTRGEMTYDYWLKRSIYQLRGEPF